MLNPVLVFTGARRLVRVVALLLLLAALAAAANSAWTQPQELSSSAFASPVLGTNALLVGSAGGASSVVLAYDGAWTATANDSFLHISSGSSSGTSSAVVVFTYDAFAGIGSRTGTLTIAGLTVTVTQAGVGYIGPIGSGPAATLWEVGQPEYLAVDRSGNVYFAWSQFNVIQEWSPSTQQMTTLVSSGLNHPSGVAVDGSGNVYFADEDSNAIREWIASTQQVTTLVSSGLNHPSGVAVDGSGNVYIADTGNNAIREWNASTQQVITLVSSGLYQPSGVAVDGSGNVYIADTGNNAIREWSPSMQQMNTLVSTGLSSPNGVAVDGSGNVYIADEGNSAIKEWSASTQQVTTLVQSGLEYPGGLAVDLSGDIYIADTGNNAVKEALYAFVGPASLTEPASAGTGSLLPVLPSTASPTGIFAATSDQSWLTIGTTANGVVSFSFAANASAFRVAHIAVLGQQITVTQNGAQNGSAPQTITFGALPTQALGTSPFTIIATASSGLPVSFNSQTASVCWVSGSQVTLFTAGTCTIQATQAGNAVYAAATPVNQSFKVILSQTITFGGLANQTLGASPFTVIATASSGLPVGFSSQTTSVCTVSGSMVTLVAAGTCTIQATQAGNANYAAATPVDQSFTVRAAVAQATVTGVGVSGGGANIAQNAWVEIYGSNLAPASVGTGGLTWSNAPSFASGQMPTELQGVSVTVDGNPAYIYFISATQVNVLTPLDSTTGPVAVAVNNGSTTSAAFTANLQAVAPGFLRFSDVIHIAAEHADYSLLGPTSMSVPGYTFTPAARGEIILLFGDGFGLPVSTLTAGSDVQTGALPTWPQVTIGGTTATVQYAGLISPGLYQINVVVPSTAANGDNQVIATYGGASSPTGAMIPISP